jgi:hypothetical protein
LARVEHRKSASEPTAPLAGFILRAAGIYNLIWGAWVVLRPFDLFDLTGAPRPLYPGIWQCVGMIVGVYGIGYWIAARDPNRHWPIVLVGLLGKLFGPLGFVTAQFSTTAPGTLVLPWSWGWTLVTNDLIWWIPFMSILYMAARANSAPQPSDGPEDRGLTVIQANARFRVEDGQSITHLSQRAPVLLIFLRHAGCTFCRQALDDLRRARARLAELKVQPVLVHMGTDQESLKLFQDYDVQDVPRISDPGCELYRAYGLGRGGASQVLGPSVWWRGLKAAVFQRHGIGRLVGDGFQMPGVFLIRDGKIVAESRHQTSGDRPDLCKLAISGSSAGVT